MADAEGMSLEETNKIRISLGLKPLKDDKAPSNSKDQEAEDNYAKRKEEDKKAKDTSSLLERIAKNKNKQEYYRRLIGTTLGEDGDGVDDTRAWVKRNKRKEKELAAKRQKEYETREVLEDYTEKDLTGLKVSHDFEDLDEGDARILTLKDSRILDNEEDELQNVDMAESERDKQRNELKTKRKGYTGYDDDEFGGGADGLKKSVLAKYDEELNGPQEKGFRLGGTAPNAKQTTKEAHEQAAAAVNKSLLSIEYAKNVEISDYAEIDKAIKKPKTKKKASRRKQTALEDSLTGEVVAPPIEEVKMQVDEVKPRTKDLDANFIDDEDLQAALSRARRQKVKRPKLTPEDIAKRLAEEQADSQVDVPDVALLNTGDAGDGIEDVGLTFDDTTEFVRAIAYDPTPKVEPKIAKLSITIQTRHSPERGNRDEAIGEMDVDADGPEEGEEGEDDEAMMRMALEEGLALAQPKAEEEDDGIGTTNETFSGGLAGTLGILRKTGVLKNPNEGQTREEIQRAHDAWLADHRRRLAQREFERMRSKGSGKDQATREYENRMREQADARDSMDAFKNYKPDVEITYYDEFGRVMDQKEAWKALSHRFHGKGSGKMKTEKRLKKIADEKKREAMASGDTPTSMNQAFQRRQEKVGQAHMVLSVGNRGAVPQLEDYLDNAVLSKASKITKTGKGKKKDAGDQTPIQAIDITAFAAANSQLAPGIIPGAARPLGSSEGSPAPAARMKPAFARISGADSGAPTPSGSGGASPIGAANGLDRTKVRIGFGLKRKAEDDDGMASPPPKR